MIGIDLLYVKGIEEWKQSAQCFDLTRWTISNEQRHSMEVLLDQRMTKLGAFWQAFPDQPRAQKRWRKKGLATMDQWIKETDLPLFDEMNQEVAELFREITFSFLRDVRSFDRKLSMADAMQALRNVWIIAILQCLFEKKVGYHQAMFAYSMLYPYTDNFLDDELRSLSEKQAFNKWLDARLHGVITQPHNDHEQKIDRLVEMIEEQFPRTVYPQVYESLYAIQNAQMDSLRQQDGERLLSDEELLAISYHKGGTSVIVDGALIDGSLNEQELAFCMRYGFMLQLGDDLQDAYIDRIHHHQTIVSMYPKGCYDPLVRKLLQYVDDICTDFNSANRSLIDFVAQNCRFLIFASLFQKNAVTISDSLRKEALACLPVSLAFIHDKKADWSFFECEEDSWKRLDVLLQ